MPDPVSLPRFPFPAPCLRLRKAFGDFVGFKDRRGTRGRPDRHQLLATKNQPDFSAHVLPLRFRQLFRALYRELQNTTQAAGGVRQEATSKINASNSTPTRIAWSVSQRRRNSLQFAGKDSGFHWAIWLLIGTGRSTL